MRWWPLSCRKKMTPQRERMPTAEQTPQLDGVTGMTDADLRRLSREPGNAVFSALPEEERAPFEMAAVAAVFRGVHRDFVAHCALRHDGDDEHRRELFRGATEAAKRCIRAHPTLFEKITTRDIATDQEAMAIFWGMIQLHHRVETGDITMDTARQAFAAQIRPPPAEKPASQG